MELLYEDGMVLLQRPNRLLFTALLKSSSTTTTPQYLLDSKRQMQLCEVMIRWHTSFTVMMLIINRPPAIIRCQA